MLNILNPSALKSIPLSKFTAADFGYTSDVRKLPVDTAYREVGWYRRGIDIRANGVTEMPFDVLRNGEAVYSEVDAVDKLPPVLNVFPILGQLTRDIDLHGAAYAVYETNQYGMNQAWRRLHPSSINPEYNLSTGELSHFTRRYGNKQMRLELDDLLYLWMPPDNSENRPGAGVGLTALLAATSLLNKDKFTAYYFENGAINPTIVKIGGFATQPTDEKEKVRGYLNRLMTGIKNAFKVIPLDGDIDVFTLISNLKDMAMTDLTLQQREDIATTLGIPQSLLFSNAANYATAMQDDIHFYDKTIVPFYRGVLAAQLNDKLFHKAGFEIRPAKSRLEVFQKQEAQKAFSLLPMFQSDLYWANEIRAKMGDDPLPQDFLYSEKRSVQGTQPFGGNSQKPPAEAGIDPADMGMELDDMKAHAPITVDLAKWERLAIKRWDEGKREKALSFASDVIPSTLKAAIVGSLEAAQTVDDVKLIFRDATAYHDHQ